MEPEAFFYRQFPQTAVMAETNAQESPEI